MTNTSISPPARGYDLGGIALVALSLLALLDSVFNYFSRGNGISGTEGALLVVVSTLLMLIAAILLARDMVRGWVRVTFEILIVLDFIGTAAAAYFLNAWLLVAVVALAAIAWLAHVFAAAPRSSHQMIG
jgi:hypothetical protein